MVVVAQLVEPRIVIPVVVGSSPIIHPNFHGFARVAELVDALDLGSSRVTCESSSLSFRTSFFWECLLEIFAADSLDIKFGSP